MVYEHTKVLVEGLNNKYRRYWFMNISRFLIALGVILCVVLAPVTALTPENTAQAQPAVSAWPMFGQNPQRTGRSPYSGPEVPKLKWSFTTGDAVQSSPAIGADGTIYVGSWDDKLYAINPDGSQKWSFNTGGDIRSSPAIGADGTIYVGSFDGKLYAINPDGTKKWSFPTGGDVFSSPAIGADGTIYVGSLDDNLYAINPATGKEKWSFTTGGDVFSSPAIGADGTIYFGSDDGCFYAREPGGQQTVIHTLDWVRSSPAIGTDGTIYVGSFDGRLYAMDPVCGSQSFTIGDAVRSSPAIGADGTIYVGSFDGKLYAINTDGTKEWSFPTGGNVYSSPTIGADGTIYVGSHDNNLYAINPATGKEKWSFTTGDDVFSSPAIGADGTIYVGSFDGKLYAITEEYDLTISSTAGGSVTDPGEGSFSYLRETVVNLVAGAEAGYRFVNWTGDVGTIADVDAATTTITMSDNYSITANFEEEEPSDEEPPDEEPSDEEPSDEEDTSDGMCFIATAAYGTAMAEEIEVLREFRDEYLMTNPVGKALVDIYYRVSPSMAEFINEHPSLKPIVRAGLLPAVAMSAVAVNTSSVEKTAIIGFLALVPVAVTIWATRRRARGTQYT
jgi:outer membrane protein assembly factor BamB